MAEDHNDEGIRDVVGQWVRKRELVLESLIKQRSKLDDEIERVRKSLEDVQPFAHTLGLEVQFSASSASAIEPVESRRRSSRSLPRKPQFARLSLPAAVEMILRENPNRDIHADEFVEQIFDVGSVSQFRSAKSSVVPSLSVGAADGRWRRVGPNTFRLDVPEREQGAVNVSTPP